MKQNRNFNFTLAMLVLLLTASLAGVLAGCAKNATPHPNQINAFDGQTYDRLTEAQAALDEAKVQYQTGKLPATAKTVINDTGAIYEQARTAHNLWRDISLGVKSGDAEATHLLLLSDMNQLAVAIVNLKNIAGGK